MNTTLAKGIATMCQRPPKSASVLIFTAAIVGFCSTQGCTSRRWLSRHDYSAMHDPFLDPAPTPPAALAAADGVRRQQRRGAGTVRLGDTAADRAENEPRTADAALQASRSAPKPLDAAPHPFRSGFADGSVAQASYPGGDVNPFAEVLQEHAQANYENSADVFPAGSEPQPVFSKGSDASVARQPPFHHAADTETPAEEPGGSLWDAPFPGPPADVFWEESAPGNEGMNPAATPAGNVPGPARFDMADDQAESPVPQGAVTQPFDEEGFWDPVDESPRLPLPASDDRSPGRTSLRPSPEPSRSPSKDQKLDAGFGTEGRWKPSNFVRP